MIKDNNKRQKFEVTSDEARKDIVIQDTPAEEWQQKDKYKILSVLIDMTHKVAADKNIEGELDIIPNAEEIAKKLDMEVEHVKECVGELHKEYLIKNGEEEGSIVVDQLELKLIRKGYPICTFCGQEMEFQDRTITNKWGKIDPEGNYVNERFVCLNKACKHQATADFRVQAKRV